MKKDILKNIIIICLIIILLDICYSMFIKKDCPVKIFGKSFLIVATDSMSPTIKSGELIIISERKQYGINDIVTYVDEDNFYVTHRIINLNKGNMITKGDGNNINDKKISIENVKGKVIFHSKILGFFVLYLLKPLVCAYFIVMIIVNVINFLIRDKGGKKEIVEKSKETIIN